MGIFLVVGAGALLQGPSPLQLQRPASAVPLRTALPIRSVATSPILQEGPEPTGYDAWAATLDYDQFRKEVNDLGKSLEKGQGEDDVKHLHRMIRMSNMCGLIGMLTMWMPLNPIAILGLSTWTCTRWTMIGHHICHGGYNRQDDGSGKYTSTGFALGSIYRRTRDWMDWMLPEAWNVEHNNLHHYRLGESGDPDLVERNLELMRTFPLPRPLKYLGVAGLAAMWKWYYYAPNTYKQLKIRDLKQQGIEVSEEDAHQPFTLPVALLDMKETAKYQTSPLDFIKRVMGPFILMRFILLPAPLALINPLFYRAAVVNLLLADVVSNIHSFIIIATNHAGNDMYKFSKSVIPKSGSFYRNAITSSVNFRTGNGVGKKVHGFRADVNDFLHGWLNYQIEHHCWPQLSMLSYQKAAPQLRAICEKHGVPYVQENVFKRLKKTADIMVGATSMRPFHANWEHPPDAFTWK